VYELVQHGGGHDERDVAPGELPGEVLPDDTVLREGGHVSVDEDVRVDPAPHGAVPSAKISS
jgi:hypothetical protein